MIKANYHFNNEIKYLVQQYEQLKDININYQHKIKQMKDEIVNLVNYCSQLITKDFYSANYK